MIWETLSEPWRACVEEAWTAFRLGSLPIGAVITNRRGEMLARGRNRFHDREADGKLLGGHRLAHAEMNALLALDWRRVIPSECILYTTTEPCPLCVGAVRMTRLREVHYAARDGAAGSADLVAANDFMRRGNVRVHGPFSDELEALLVALLVEFALAQNDDNTVSWVAHVGQCAPRGLALGRELAETGALRAWARDQRPAGDMVDALALRLTDLTA